MAGRVVDPEPGDGEFHGPVEGTWTRSRPGRFGADDQLAQAADVRLRRGQRRHRATGPHDGDRVGDGADLFEVVGHEDHGQPVGGQLRQRGEQRRGVLGHEDRGGLVEQHRPGSPVEDLDELDPLALRHAEVLHGTVGAHRQAAGRGQPFDAPPGGPDVDPAPSRRLGSEDDVFEDGQVLGQHEVLVHETDPGPDRGPRRTEAHGNPVDADRSGVGAQHPGQDLHQRRLARAVLADQGVNLARAGDQARPVVGDDAGIALDDAVEGHHGGAPGRLRGYGGP